MQHMPMRSTKRNTRIQSTKHFWQSPIYKIEQKLEALFIVARAQIKWRKRLMDLEKEVKSLKEQVNDLSNRVDK